MHIMPPRKRPATDRTRVARSRHQTSSTTVDDAQALVSGSVQQVEQPVEAEPTSVIEETSVQAEPPSIKHTDAEHSNHRVVDAELHAEDAQAGAPATAQSRTATPPPTLRPVGVSPASSPELSKRKSSPASSISPTLASASFSATEKIEGLRPPLPNVINSLLPEEATVKLQVIEREVAGVGREILVGRVKVPISVKEGVTSHKFLLKSFETDSIMADTMFDLAFPSATAEEKAREMEYVAAFALHANPVVFPGTWVPVTVARSLADEYGIVHLLNPLIESEGTIISGNAYFVDSEGTPSHSHNATALAEDEIAQLLLSSTYQEPSTESASEEVHALPDAKEALDAARKEAQAIQLLSSPPASKTSKRRVEDMEAPVTQASTGRAPAGRKMITPARVRALVHSHPISSGVAGGLAATVAATAAGCLLPEVNFGGALAAVQAGMSSVQHWFV